MIWAQAQAGYLQALRSRGRAASTQHQAGRILSAFVAFCQAREAGLPRDLTAFHLADYRRHLSWTVGPRGRLPQLSTVAGKLCVVRSFARWLVAEGHLLMDPTADLVIPKPPRTLPRLLSVEEVARILAAPDPRRAHGLRDRAILEVLYGLGLRRRECRQLDLVDYDRRHQTLCVRKPKNRQERRLPVGPHLEEALKAYLTRGRPALARHPDEPALFLSSRTGRRISLLRLDQMVAGTAQAVGLPGVGCHAFRHACATHLLAGGADIRYIQALLGHADLASTETYTHLQPLELIAEHRRTHPRAGSRGARGVGD